MGEEEVLVHNDDYLKPSENVPMLDKNPFARKEKMDDIFDDLAVRSKRSKKELMEELKTLGYKDLEQLKEVSVGE